MNHVFLKPAHSNKPKEKSACFMGIKNYEDSFMFSEGERLIDEFPEDAYYEMNTDRNFPHGNTAQDLLVNSGPELVVSETIKNHLALKLSDSQVEYLSTRVLDKKKNPLVTPYHIVNILTIIDCINRDLTKYEVNSIDEDSYEDIENLTLSKDVLEDLPYMFRIKHIQNMLAVHRDFIAFLKSLGCSHFQWAEINGWSECPGSFVLWKWPHE